VEFLLERLSEEETAAHMALTSDEQTWFQISSTDADMSAHTLLEHLRHQSPGKILAECDSKRRIVALVVRPVQLRPARRARRASLRHDQAVELLKLLALPYRNHPGYRRQWLPH